MTRLWMSRLVFTMPMTSCELRPRRFDRNSLSSPSEAPPCSLRLRKSVMGISWLPFFFQDVDELAPRLANGFNDWLEFLSWSVLVDFEKDRAIAGTGIPEQAADSGGELHFADLLA